MDSSDQPRSAVDSSGQQWTAVSSQDQQWAAVERHMPSVRAPLNPSLDAGAAAEPHMLQSTTKRPSLATLFFRRPLSIHARTLQRAGQSSPRRPPRPLHRVPWPTEAAESARWPRQGASWPAWPRWWKSHPQGRDRLPQGRDCVQGTPERLTVKHQLCTLRRSFRSPSASETTPSQRRDVSGHGPCE